jgi:hypothetical protein
MTWGIAVRVGVGMRWGGLKGNWEKSEGLKDEDGGRGEERDEK